MFSWQEQYPTRSLRSLVRYCCCHSNIKFISSRHRVISSIYFHTFIHKIFNIISCDIIGKKMPYCLSDNYNPELGCVILLVLHFLHWCYTRTALLSANQKRVIFFMYVINRLIANNKTRCQSHLSCKLW